MTCDDASVASAQRDDGRVVGNATGRRRVRMRERAERENAREKTHFSVDRRAERTREKKVREYEENRERE